MRRSSKKEHHEKSIRARQAGPKMVAFSLLGRATTLLATTSPLARRAGGAAMIGSLFGMRPEPVMVKPEDALPGRPNKVPVASEHYVLSGNKMEGPWPEGYKVAIFANGCFVRCTPFELTRSLPTIS